MFMFKLNEVNIKITSTLQFSIFREANFEFKETAVLIKTDLEKQSTVKLIVSRGSMEEG